MAKNKLVVPFLKWVGGKRQLIPEIRKLLPKGVSSHPYYEPFIGGGALFFDLQPKCAIINDCNKELINAYRIIRDNPKELIEDLKKHKNTAEYFYEIRAIDRQPIFYNLTNIERASRIIFLNKTCYNGLYRVNNAGEFNSPFGNYKNPNIVNEPVINAWQTLSCFGSRCLQDLIQSPLWFLQRSMPKSQNVEGAYSLAPHTEDNAA